MMSNDTIASHMMRRLENVEEVKEGGPVKAEEQFNLADPVVVLQYTGAATKEWQLHRTATEFIRP